MKNYLTIVSIILVLMIICGCQPEAKQTPRVTEADLQATREPIKAPEQPVEVKKITPSQPVEKVEEPQKEQVVEETIPEPQTQTDSLLVTINGEEIYESDVLETLKPQLDRVTQKATPQQLEQYKQQLIQRSLEKVVVEKLLSEKVKAANITVTDEEVDEKITEMASNQQPPLSMEDFKALVEAYGQSFEEVRKGIGKGLGFQKVMELQWDDEQNKVEVTEQEVLDYYNENKQRFETPERVQASHILIKIDTSDLNADPNQVKAVARAKAEKLLEEIKAGADFAELAKQHSDCPSSARGGDLGLFARGSMVPPFEKVAFELKVGQVSGIVETRFGYHIIKVAEREQAATKAYDEVKERLLDMLTQQKQQKLAQEYIAALKAEADIVYAPGKEPMPRIAPMSPMTPRQ